MFDKKIFGFLAILFVLFSVVSGLDANSVAGDGSWAERTIIFNPSANEVEDLMDDLGYSGTQRNQISASAFENYLEDDYLMYFIGHGMYGAAHNGIWTKDTDNDGIIDYSELFLDSDVGSNNERLVVYNACATCLGDLCEETVDNGADCVIGWSDSITAGDGKCFGKKLFQYLEGGYSVHSASYSAALSCNDLTLILRREGSCYIYL